jgi:hypothetical protein
MLQMAIKNISKRKTSNINTLRSYYKYPKVKLHRKSVLSCWDFYVKIVSFSFCVGETGKKKLDFVSELPYLVVTVSFIGFRTIEMPNRCCFVPNCKAGYPGFKPGGKVVLFAPPKVERIKLLVNDFFLLITFG